MLTNSITPTAISDFAADVRSGLSRAAQKELPSKYLYDALGSRLFEAICELPEYGLTRADERLLRSNAHEIALKIPGELLVCELGSGTGRKTRYVLEALARRRHITYFPIELSAIALDVCRRELSDMDSVGIVGLESEYLGGLLKVAAGRKEGQRILVLFLGSTLGNFSPPSDLHFLRDVRRILKPGDVLLLGTDLDKPHTQLLAAYADPLGVTAAFNLNLLARMNRELNASFDLSHFEHHAKFNPDTNSVEMHIRSLRRQTVLVPDAYMFVEFKAGETIWTENCHKYLLSEIEQIARSSSFGIEAQWIDEEWPFAETLLTANVE